MALNLKPGLAPTLPPKVTTKPGDRNLKLFPSQGTGMAGNTASTRTGREQGSDDSNNATRQDLDLKDSETFKLNTLMLSAIIGGFVSFICVVAVVLLCFWRRKRSESLNQQQWPTLPQAPSDTIRSEEIIWLERQPRKDSRNPILGSAEIAETNACNNEVITTDSREISDTTDTISRPPDTPLHRVLEGPDGTGTIMGRPLSSNNEQTPERFRSETDDEPVLNEAREAIASSSKGREKDAVYEETNTKRFTDAAGSSDTLDNNDEYCYSYMTDLPFKDEKSRPHEDSKTHGSLYHSVEGPNAGYQALEGTPANEYTPMEDVIELSGYQPLQKSTRSVYQQLRKTTTEAPRGAFIRK